MVGQLSTTLWEKLKPTPNREFAKVATGYAVILDYPFHSDVGWDRINPYALVLCDCFQHRPAFTSVFTLAASRQRC
jgi:hypothetical protein